MLATNSDKDEIADELTRWADLAECCSSKETVVTADQLRIIAEALRNAFDKPDMDCEIEEITDKAKVRFRLHATKLTGLIDDLQHLRFEGLVDNFNQLLEDVESDADGEFVSD